MIFGTSVIELALDAARTEVFQPSSAEGACMSDSAAVSVHHSEAGEGKQSSGEPEGTSAQLKPDFFDRTPAHPFAHQAMPYFACSSALLKCALRSPVDSSTAADFARIDPSRLNAQGLLRRMQLADQLSAWAAAQAARALADYVGPDCGDADADRHHRLEVRIARKCSDNAAGGDIVNARRLASDARRVRDAWEGGHITSRHVFIAMDRTALAEPALSAAVFEQLGSRLNDFSTAQLGTAITKTMCRLDARGQAQRTRTARRHNVGVSFRSLPDGLGQVVATHRIEDARALMDVIDTKADRILDHRRECEPCTEAIPDEIGPARAAAHLALTLGTSVSESPVSESPVSESPVSESPARQKHPRRGVGELQVVVDLTTLLGLTENPGLAAGYPVPAEIARELADECGAMRRIVTDPVTGHLLDYGHRTYLPAPLKKFIAARDGTCRSPGCGQPAGRSQLDHIEPYPTGPSNTHNTHSLCKRDHDSKTAGDFHVIEHDSSGRMYWRTRDGQQGVLGPRPYLGDPADQPSSDAPSIDQPSPQPHAPQPHAPQPHAPQPPPEPNEPYPF